MFSVDYSSFTTSCIVDPVIFSVDLLDYSLSVLSWTLKKLIGNMVIFFFSPRVEFFLTVILTESVVLHVTLMFTSPNICTEQMISCGVGNIPLLQCATITF